MAAFLWWFGGDLATWLVTAEAASGLAWLAGLVAGGIGIYFAALWVMGVRAGQFRLQAPATSL